MKDYKKLKLEYKLGGLGPSQDPQLVKEKVSIIFGDTFYWHPIEMLY